MACWPCTFKVPPADRTAQVPRRTTTASPFMDFTFHRPYKTELHPVKCVPQRPSADLFDLRILYREDGSWQFRDRVHVPREVQAAFANGEVHGFHLETLGMNSAACRALSESPQFAVLGVELADGCKLAAVPGSLVRARRIRLFAAAAIAIVGVAAAFTPLSWFGGLAAGASLQLLRTALSIRVQPFWPPARKDLTT
jgi:hypothetical protein